MIAELILIAAIGIYDPMDMSGHEMYPSGVKEVDKYPKYAPKTTKMAQLTLPRNIIAKDGRIILSGHYLATFAISRREILIFDGENEIYTLNVCEEKILPRKMKLPEARFYTYNNGEAFIILTIGKYRAKAKVNLDYL